MRIYLALKDDFLAESQRSSSRLTNKSVDSDASLESKSENPSPRTVLSEYQSVGDENSSCGDYSLSATDSSSATPNLAIIKSNSRNRRRFSPYALIVSVLGSPFRRRSFDKQVKQPLLRCFSYEEIANATNNFHPGESIFNETLMFSICCLNNKCAFEFQVKN